MYDELLENLAILVLSGFVGFAVISKVPNTLHTPLMSGTNAIHGIVVLGALVVFGEVEHPSLAVQIILFVAVVFGTLNVIGGFIVTDRMLGMFKGKKSAPAKSEPPDTPLGRMYHEHIGFIKAKNVDGILNQYDPDALVIGVLTEGRKPRYVRGRDELREFFTGNFGGLKSLTSRIDQWAETENALMIVESIELELADGSSATTSFNDNWVLEDGRIVVHFAGVVRYPDGSYA